MIKKKRKKKRKIKQKRKHNYNSITSVKMWVFKKKKHFLTLHNF